MEKVMVATSRNLEETGTVICEHVTAMSWPQGSVTLL